MQCGGTLEKRQKTTGLKITTAVLVQALLSLCLQFSVCSLEVAVKGVILVQHTFKTRNLYVATGEMCILFSSIKTVLGKCTFLQQS